MDLQEVGCGYVDWIRLAQDKDCWWTLVRAVMNKMAAFLMFGSVLCYKDNGWLGRGV
jgi:drug/metabolite transporter superfamily protein YnfA